MDHEKSIHDTWKFIYKNNSYESYLIQYKKGFYLNTDTNEKYSFEEGIKHIIGEEGEMIVYNRWWSENS